MKSPASEPFADPYFSSRNLTFQNGKDDQAQTGTRHDRRGTHFSRWSSVEISIVWGMIAWLFFHMLAMKSTNISPHFVLIDSRGRDCDADPRRSVTDRIALLQRVNPLAFSHWIFSQSSLIPQYGDLRILLTRLARTSLKHTIMVAYTKEFIPG